MTRVYRANMGGSVANVRYPVCPGIVNGVWVVRYFFCSFGVFASLSVSSVDFCKEKQKETFLSTNDTLGGKDSEHVKFGVHESYSVDSFTFVFTNSKSITFIIFVLMYSSICKISIVWISVKPFCCNASQLRCTCSMHGENEQNRPPESSKCREKENYHTFELIEFYIDISHWKYTKWDNESFGW